SLAEYDAAKLVGCPSRDYQISMEGRTAVSRGHDFLYDGRRYQVKANRPSGKPGSFVTLVSRPKNYDWDLLVWVLYDRQYKLQEAWLWDVADFKRLLGRRSRLSPKDLRKGQCLKAPRVSTSD